ncbi:MAG: hypothetical protein ABIK99_01405 [candidate division WOR-3 bacterium]
MTNNIDFLISIPLLLNYQGKLTDNIGNPVRDSSYSVTFRSPHTNLGFARPTETSGWNHYYCPVVGGYPDTAVVICSFTTNNPSVVPLGYTNSPPFRTGEGEGVMRILRS